MSDFIEHLHDLLKAFGPVQVRRMFSGHGVFHQGLMIGLVVRDQLYLKADAHNAPEFIAQDLPPFSYRRQGRPASLSYYLAPAAVLEDRAQAAQWARRSYEAALRSRPRPRARPG